MVAAPEAAAPEAAPRTRGERAPPPMRSACSCSGHLSIAKTSRLLSPPPHLTPPPLSYLHRLPPHLLRVSQELVDRLYDEFGHQPFTILLPSSATASRGDAPLFSRGRSVLHSIIERFLASGGWSEWAASGGLAASAAVGLELQAAKAREPLPPPSNGKPKKQPPQPPPDPSKWDGWD